MHIFERARQFDKQITCQNGRDLKRLFYNELENEIFEVSGFTNKNRIRISGFGTEARGGAGY